MIEKWNVFDKLDYIGVLTYNTSNKSVNLSLIGNTQRAIEGYKALNADKDQSWFRETLFDRIFPRNRVNARELLDEMGLQEYDEWEIIKKCRLTSVNDLIWMTKGTDPMEFYTVHWSGEMCWERDFPNVPYTPMEGWEP